MSKKIKNPFYWLGSLIFSGLVFLMTNKVLAQGGGVGTGPIKLPNPLGTTNIIQIINNVLNYLIYISVPILAIMILIGGFQILIARDNPEKIQSGRKTLMYAVIGFTIILISKGVALILLRIMS
ncbi:hypothetical protein COS60_00105 [Candidatus Wolfebacteria bacterium CG03_land_8_20_14_0_80_39_317]|uniref:Uncharacterized protein n=2 Tax=Candidatus Wolfeibacteriota TaxID=1752735 RepID=A0A2M8D8G0_9BACT|nr:hypothetical protein [Parcubacteria group bacterium]NCO89363.1 hypothetical protein [Candidatus Wolfebacteria bacterium]PIU98996.1 MAG: hypothetical protein COS60_00105 [Candidatus Wolfebacteria bacterium CG03_land_8_20_14_0_80_39_317]PJB83423.1 MAG: hypothetical protein CO087_01805 [Candidatus Wolfebacteria bacterium CG_4_9_14_0_8_um_filter_39_46]